MQPDPQAAEEEEEEAEEAEGGGDLKAYPGAMQGLRIAARGGDQRAVQHKIATLALSMPTRAALDGSEARARAIERKRKSVAMTKIQDNILRIEEKMGELKAQLKNKKGSPKVAQPRGEHRSRMHAVGRDEKKTRRQAEGAADSGESGNWFSWF